MHYFNFKKKLLGALGILLPLHCLAYPFYLEAEAGYGFLNYSNITLENNFSATTQSNGFVGRPTVGYQISKYFSAELSLIIFGNNPEFNNITNQAGQVLLTHQTILNNFTSMNGILNLPLIKSRLILQPTAGIGFVGRTGITYNNMVILRQGTFIRPDFGAGIRVMMYKGWYASTSWRYICSDITDQLPHMNYMGAGIGYQFS